MARSITEGVLIVDPPATSGRDSFIVPGEDVLELSLGAETAGGVGQGEFTVVNDFGKYTTGTDQIRQDDRIYVEATLDAAPTPDRAFSTGDFGDGPFGGGPTDRIGTVIVTDTSVDGVEQASTLTGSLENFVFNRLGERQTNYAAFDRPIATGDDDDPGHLDAILAADAPEINRDRISAVDATVDFAIRKQPVRKAVTKLARLARGETGDPVLTAARGGSLLFQPLSERSLAVGETLTLGTGGDLAELETTTEPPTATEIRVEGGIDTTNLVDDSQETVSAYETVTTSTRKTYQVSVRKSELSKVDIHTRALAGSSDRVRVRVQADDGGAPIAPGDADSDIVSATAEDQPSDTGDFQTIQLGSHTLPPKSDPWLIVEATGDDGVEVGVDGASDIAFRAYFPKPVIVKRSDPAADATFLAHEQSTNNDALVTFAAADQLAKAELERKAVARTTVTATAQSVRAHNLEPGDLVDLDAAWARAEGTHIVTERDQAFTDLNGRLITTLGFESESTYI